MARGRKSSTELRRRPSAKPIVYEDQYRRMTSIRRKLHIRLIRRKLGIYLFSDVFLFFAAMIAFLAGVEYQRFSAFKPLMETKRFFTVGTERELLYIIADKGGETLLRADITLILGTVLTVVLTLMGIQLIGFLLDYFAEDRRIRKILNPINEIALKADELSRLSFTEDKYQMLEDAIEHIQPGEESQLSFQDSDLLGVEAAINNLLLRMRDTYRQQARFVNDASHELRTPIAVIQGYANMLDRWGKEDEKILDESISAIRNEADHMNHLVEQLLFLARGDSGKTSVTLEEVDLSAMMQEVYEESFMIDEEHPYRYRAPEGEITIQADPGLLKQAVRILVDNAAKYIKKGDEILLECGRDASGNIYIQVQDTGIGMEEADVRQMFERFYRSDEVRSYQGTGLGTRIRIVLPR